MYYKICNGVNMLELHIKFFFNITFMFCQFAYQLSVNKKVPRQHCKSVPNEAFCFCRCLGLEQRRKAQAIPGPCLYLSAEIPRALSKPVRIVLSDR